MRHKIIKIAESTSIMNFSIQSFYKLSLILLLSFTTNFLFAQESVDQKINNAIKNADAAMLSNHMANTIELSLPGNEGNFSKKQATILLQSFFKDNPPKSFKVKHKGTSNDDSVYCICEYETSVGIFRTYYLCSAQNGALKLFQLTFNKK